MNTDNNIRNGRVDISTPSKHTMYTQPQQNISHYRDATTGNWTRTVLSQAFFSQENILIVHNGIRVGVYKLSGNKHIIGNQSIENLKIIMRSVFLDRAKFIKNQVTKEIEYLNNIVLQQCIPQILSEIRSYTKYKEDVSTLAVPICNPKSDNIKGNNSLELKPFF